MTDKSKQGSLEKTETDISILKDVLTKKPTQGEWYWDGYDTNWLRTKNHGIVASAVSDNDYTASISINEINKEFISACSPDRISRLLTQLENYAVALEFYASTQISSASQCTKCKILTIHQHGDEGNKARAVLAKFASCEARNREGK